MSVTFIPGKTHYTQLPGPAGYIETALHLPADATLTDTSPGIAIVCHPHPQHGGTMDNKVVTTLDRVCQQLGLATVRFNYRGVGKSAGKYGQIQGECDDCQAVLAALKTVYPEQPLWLLGFSFGSYIAAHAATQWSPSGLVSIAPPVTRMPFKQLTNITCPWLVVQGDADEVVNANDVTQWAAKPPSPLHYQLLPGVGHFFHGQLNTLRDLLIAQARQWGR